MVLDEVRCPVCNTLLYKTGNNIIQVANNKNTVNINVIAGSIIETVCKNGHKYIVEIGERRN